ncbi:MAG: cytochrome c nitrite reductase small subunit [Gemmataceae bacterium]|nr:cytochrome c nitrite reductase small subunit [Gemmataceae bacterium]MDW8265685.1 cytochrome c nitrite reductase small subunit [Gemmataceae bacterium]
MDPRSRPEWSHAAWPWVVSAAGGVLLGLSAYAFQYAEGLSYFRDDPRACVNCHVMREAYDSWHHASHRAHAVCNDCHTPHDPVSKYLVKAENGFWHSKAFTFRDFPEPIRIRPRNAAVVRRNCVECHHDLVAAIVGPGETDCVRCHEGAGHGPPR